MISRLPDKNVSKEKMIICFLSYCHLIFERFAHVCTCTYPVNWKSLELGAWYFAQSLYAKCILPKLLLMKHFSILSLSFFGVKKRNCKW